MKFTIEIPVEQGRPTPAEATHIMRQVERMLVWQMNPGEWKKITTTVQTGYGRAEVKVE